MLSHDTHQVSERMSKLEGRISQSSGVGEPLRDHNDRAYATIAFLNFPTESSVYQRLKGNAAIHIETLSESHPFVHKPFLG